MVRKACCSDLGLNRGPWTPEEDLLLKNYVQTHGEGQWSLVPHRAGLVRCGRSCRLRWMNYLRPDVKHGNISPEEEELIIELHKVLGNRWSMIAARMPGRTDNQIKNVWYSRLSKKVAKTKDCNVSKPLPSRPSPKESNLTANENSSGEKNNETNIFQSAATYSMHYENEKEMKKVCEESIARLPEWPNMQSLFDSSENVMDGSLFQPSISQLYLDSGVQNDIDIILQNAINWYNLRPYFDPSITTEQVQVSHDPPSLFYMNHNSYGTVSQFTMESEDVGKLQ
ncbi:hypothetical protein SUGI_0750630 [Cryptomeria japonica]|uniref:transcription factor WER-like n=1 Tax=Cryptomeria japonica TaxID=3369 RepID=UPI0024149E74|nr:transcription factor WER-like [Cryptomeria japonica]GLJ37046.1 hypothetical protein SUGI_0750630 [Cryptomeria japonica]